MYNYAGELIRWAGRIQGRRVHNGHLGLGKLKDSALAQVKKLEAAEREGLTAKVQKLPGELPGSVCWRMKKLETDVQRQRQPKMHLHKKTRALQKGHTSCFSFLFHPSYKPIGWCHPQLGRSFPSVCWPICQSSTDIPGTVLYYSRSIVINGHMYQKPTTTMLIAVSVVFAKDWKSRCPTAGKNNNMLSLLTGNQITTYSNVILGGKHQTSKITYCLTELSCEVRSQNVVSSEEEDGLEILSGILSYISNKMF